MAPALNVLDRPRDGQGAAFRLTAAPGDRAVSANSQMGDDRPLPAPVLALPAYTIGDALGLFARLLHSLGYQATHEQLLEEAAARDHHLTADAATCSEVCTADAAVAVHARLRRLHQPLSAALPRHRIVDQGNSPSTGRLYRATTQRHHLAMHAGSALRARGAARALPRTGSGPACRQLLSGSAAWIRPPARAHSGAAGCAKQRSRPQFCRRRQHGCHRSCR